MVYYCDGPFLYYLFNSDTGFNFKHWVEVKGLLRLSTTFILLEILLVITISTEKKIIIIYPVYAFREILVKP